MRIKYKRLLNENKIINQTENPSKKLEKTEKIKNEVKRSSKDYYINSKNKQNEIYDKTKNCETQINKKQKIIKNVYNKCNTSEIKVTSKKIDDEKTSNYKNNEKKVVYCKYTIKNSGAFQKKIGENKKSQNQIECSLHNKKYTHYCKKCKTNICIDCIKIHITLKKQIIELSSIFNNNSKIEKTINKEPTGKNKKFNDAIENFINNLKKKANENINKINGSLKLGKNEENKYIDDFLNIDENDLYKRGLFLLSLFYKNKNGIDHNNLK